jgi:hypothetical protein
MLEIRKNGEFIQMTMVEEKIPEIISHGRMI